jgi:simple sugar transport system ATP-binding protein
LQPIVELRHVSKSFGTVSALEDLSFGVYPGEVQCLLGDNGAGKSTLIKILAGVHRLTSGEYLIDGKPVAIASPREALDAGIATVYQDLAMVPLMSITRNFFMGRELNRGWGPFTWFDVARADEIVLEQLAQIGIDVRDPGQAVGTLSGGERQCVAIARAVYFGARVLILDEPTSALGVHQASIVLKYVAQARQRGLGVIFISHNIHHAYAVADRFTLLNRGRSQGTFKKTEISRDEVLHVMAGGEDLQRIQAEIGMIHGAPPPAD